MATELWKNSKGAIETQAQALLILDAVGRYIAHPNSNYEYFTKDYVEKNPSDNGWTEVAGIMCLLEPVIYNPGLFQKTQHSKFAQKMSSRISYSAGRNTQSMVEAETLKSYIHLLFSK